MYIGYTVCKFEIKGVFSTLNPFQFLRELTESEQLL